MDSIGIAALFLLSVVSCGCTDTLNCLRFEGTNAKSRVQRMARGHRETCLSDSKDCLMKTPEYTEGPEALENFKRLATAILQAPSKKQKRQTKKSASLRKPKKSDRD